MQRILTVGVYDYFHYGHLRLFEQAKNAVENGYLIVAVQDSEFIRKFKPEAKVFYSTDVRKELVGALKCVDEVTSYTEVQSAVKENEFDVFAVGEDQKHAGFLEAIDYCKKNGKKVVYLHRTPNISSTSIKENLEVSSK
ncbi:adenylyltransferase/cytidyltransferase family protein [bacterium]|nr:adenylyltransferase/cytidyltransferase family protein [bacterium]